MTYLKTRVRYLDSGAPLADLLPSYPTISVTTPEPAFSDQSNSFAPGTTVTWHQPLTLEIDDANKHPTRHKTRSRPPRKWPDTPQLRNGGHR
jgi:hypothetical protein